MLNRTHDLAIVTWTAVQSVLSTKLANGAIVWLAPKMNHIVHYFPHTDTSRPQVVHYLAVKELSLHSDKCVF